MAFKSGAVLSSLALTRSAAARLSQRRLIHVFRDVAALREHRRRLLLDDKTVGLVPTMGALHAGHISLVRQAARENSHVFVTIYVNPTQFGVNEDLDSYPKTWDSDMKQLEALDVELSKAGMGRVDAIFAPTTKTMYPILPPDSTLPGVGSFVTITPLASLLEGKSRPVFFRGVATVCMKLFNIVQPERVYFGQKDAQQTVIIKRLIKDFHLNTLLRVLPTEREADGLAMSSRNVYLGARRRKAGLALSQALRAAERAYLSGTHSREIILAAAWQVIHEKQREQEALNPAQRASFEVDYISLADIDSLEEVDEVDATRGALLSAAIKMLPLASTSEGEVLGLGNDQVPVRLIDNTVLQPSVNVPQ